MIKKLDLKDSNTEDMVLEIQLVSYSVETRMINFYNILHKEDAVDYLYNCNELFNGFISEGRLA